MNLEPYLCEIAELSSPQLRGAIHKHLCASVALGKPVISERLDKCGDFDHAMVLQLATS